MGSRWGPLSKQQAGSAGEGQCWAAGSVVAQALRSGDCLKGLSLAVLLNEAPSLPCMLCEAEQAAEDKQLWGQ